MTASPGTPAPTAPSSDEQPFVIAHLDCSTGVSGDKFLGALLEAGSQNGTFTAGMLQDAVAGMAPEAVITVAKTASHGVSATGVHVTAQTPQPHARTFADIRTLIESAALPTPVATNALKVFTLIAEAEAIVHGTTPDEVHFHEVGALDSLLDVVGVCLGLHALGINALYATPPALGSGTVTTSHGELPVPAPATAALMLNLPTSVSNAPGELTTPTGAALLHLAAGFGPVPPLTPVLLGYGAGTRDIGQPNICRLIVGEARYGRTTALERDRAILLETNIDHIAPEAVAFAGEELLAEGALDVWVTPIAMKKGRAGLTLSVLAAPVDAEKTAERIIELTGTLGVRVGLQERIVAERETVELATPWGTITLKHGAGRYRPEHEDIARISRETGLPYLEVLDTVREKIAEAGNDLLASPEE